MEDKMKNNRIKRFFRAAADVIYPPKCVGCGEVIDDRRTSRMLCTSCYGKFLSEITEKCHGCGRELSLCTCTPKSFIPDGFAYSMPYDKEKGVTRRLILCCKNRRISAVFSKISELMAETAEKRGIIKEADMITFVPRSPELAAKNGIDQAEELAKQLSKKVGIKCIPTIAHRHFSREQKTLHGAARTANAERAYVFYADASRVKGKFVILVDDVVTTGSTVNACAELLKQAGAEKVFCLSAAKSIKRYQKEEKTVVSEAY